MASPTELMALNQYELGPGRLTGRGGGGGIMDLMAGLMQRQKIQEEEKLKKQKNKADMYKTLRDAGYEPKKAFEAVQAGQFPEEFGGETSKEKVANANIDRLKAQTKKLTTQPSAALRARITEKVANGEDLTPGEQKVYDEVIRKYGQKSDLSSVLERKANKIDQTQQTEYVPMFDSQGNKKKVPKANVEKAKSKGWKLR